MRIAALSVLFAIVFACTYAQPTSTHDLRFEKLATTWDEGIPLGNATLGALIWEKNGELRFSLDRVDLWDLRPMNGLDLSKHNYVWIGEQLKNNNYKTVQQQLDEPYEKEAAPSKIPAAALMIDSKSWGEVRSVHLNIATALCTVEWKNGTVLETYVHATKPQGWFRIKGLKGTFKPRIDPPSYVSDVKSGAGSVEGDDLNRLGYEKGELKSKLTNAGTGFMSYHQKGWNNFYYDVRVSIRKEAGIIEGKWTIHSSLERKQKVYPTKRFIRTFSGEFESHKSWWTDFWSKSSLTVPDKLLERQWYLEMYKFGSAARKDAPPISLQAVWTADNGRLPPWKGDFHHDLNTQLSYWPAYSANHLEEATGYLAHLDSNKGNYKRYTKTFFQKDGLNVPGVTTLEGTEMGGWIQYSGSPTISAWLAQHYYLQWRYSLDSALLRNSVYPWLEETATFIENITTKNAKGLRELPLSSSPEIYNNSAEAWFTTNTNYDLALMKYAVEKAAEIAGVLGKSDDEQHWKTVLSEFGEYSLSADNELMFAAGKPYNESHRHFSNMMAVHPLGLIKWEDGEREQAIIRNSIKLLDSVGPGWWCGYSYSWLANLKARAKDGEGAAKALETFARAFCLKNSFHVNGDQTKSGLSNFTYRPFTLEGNFAFAAGLQEMLMQSNAGFIELFPAVPAGWKDISFNTLRAEGAVLVSAIMKNGEVIEFRLQSEKGGKTRIKMPKVEYGDVKVGQINTMKKNGDYLDIEFPPGGSIVFRK